MALVLLSGRPGAGNTAYATWLQEHRGFHRVECDQMSQEWGPRVHAESAAQAEETRRYAASLGPNVIVEWGFLVEQLPYVGRLRDAGFDAWWFDGDEPAARAGWIERHGIAGIGSYEGQAGTIAASSEVLHRFYGDHVVWTVTPGPTYLAPDRIALLMFGEWNESGDGLA